jgi:hypothetical protein
MDNLDNEIVVSGSVSSKPARTSRTTRGGKKSGKRSRLGNKRLESEEETPESVTEVSKLSI